MNYKILLKAKAPPYPQDGVKAGGKFWKIVEPVGSTN